MDSDRTPRIRRVKLSLEKWPEGEEKAAKTNSEGLFIINSDLTQSYISLTKSS